MKQKKQIQKRKRVKTDNGWTAVSVGIIATAVLMGWVVYETAQYNSLAYKEGYTQTTLPGCPSAVWVKK
jgi:predicted negative regulator of RcsB-dependent stress response